MKFSNGHWINREQTEVFSVGEVYFKTIEADKVTIIAPTSKIYNRGCTLGGANITFEITAPFKNVFHIRQYHHAGFVDATPHFEVAPGSDGNLSCEETDDKLILGSGDFTLEIVKDTCDFFYMRGDEKVTSSVWRDLSLVKTNYGGMAYDMDSKDTFMRAQLSLSVGECVYGLGERFTPFVKNGQTIDMWNEDGGTATELSYKNIPFYVTNKGYGVFVNHAEKVSFEVGSEVVTKVGFSVPGEVLDYYVIDGPTMKEAVSRYTDITGKPALPPEWTYGLWLSTSFTTDYDEKTVMSFIDGMFERDIPLSVFHFDCFWMKEFSWTDFTWDERVFPDPKGMLSRIKEKGLKVCVWINPYIGQNANCFKECMDKGYFIKRPDGSVWQWDMWQPGMAIIDFTNPEACRWYSNKLKELLDMGVDCFKTDFGERIPTNVVYHDGSDPVKMHNFYTYLYNRCVFEAVKEVKGEDEAVVFARSATAGGQKFPVHWGGDCFGNYESMEESLRGGLSLCTSGFGFWSHDIGGFENTSTADVYKRWCAFGLLSTHSRLHGSGSYRVPWVYDEEAVDVLRFFVKLKQRLMPYILECAKEAHSTGVPVMRPMVMEFPEDKNCHYLANQYMLGDALLVAPIFNDKSVAEYYLPEGTWMSIITREQKEGGRWYKEEMDYFNIPAFMRREIHMDI